MASYNEAAASAELSPLDRVVDGDIERITIGEAERLLAVDIPKRREKLGYQLEMLNSVERIILERVRDPRVPVPEDPKPEPRIQQFNNWNPGPLTQTEINDRYGRG